MRTVAIALFAAAALAACAGSGTASGTGTGTGSGAEPTVAFSPTAPPAASPATTSSASSSPVVNPPTKRPFTPFALTSQAFVEGGAIPAEFTCDGAGTSPPLEWTGIPDGTAALALVVDDPDAGGFVHWVVYDIDPAMAGLAEGASTAVSAPAQGRNSFGQTGYGGPCPPSGTHHYVFRLLALDLALGLSGAPQASEVVAAAEGHILGEARLTGTYRRGG
jgi:hypothetical protein